MKAAKAETKAEPRPEKVRVRVKANCMIRTGYDAATRTPIFAKGGEWIEVDANLLSDVRKGVPSGFHKSVETEKEAQTSDARAKDVLPKRGKVKGEHHVSEHFNALKRAAIEHREAAQRANEHQQRDVASSTIRELQAKAPQ